MTADDLGLLPEPCGRCAFWETSVADLAAPAEHPDRAARKAEWAETVTAHWGWCGVVAMADDEVIGFVTMAPARHVRRLGAFATTPVGPDVAVLLSAQVVDVWRGKGLGRQLVTSAAALVTRRDIRALEAVGTHHDGPSCMMPVGWLEAVGFAVVREHPVTPRLRMDLQTTQRWRPGLGAAWSRLTELVTSPAPQPASYAGREPEPAPSPRPVVVQTL